MPSAGVGLDSRAQLWIARLDYHLVKSWDITGELRMLTQSTSQDVKTGTLVGPVQTFVQPGAKLPSDVDDLNSTLVSIFHSIEGVVLVDFEAFLALMARD